MKFMMLMIPAIYQRRKPGPDFEPAPKQMEAMGRYNQELGKAFKIESVNGLQPIATGARVSFSNGSTSVTDGSSIDAQQVFGGYWLLEAPSKEAVVTWAQRCPAEEGDTIEIRQVYEPHEPLK